MSNDFFNLMTVLLYEVARGPVPVAKLESLESRLDRVREKRVKFNLISRVGYGASHIDVQLGYGTHNTMPVFYKVESNP